MALRQMWKKSENMRVRQWNTSKIIWNIRQVNGEIYFPISYSTPILDFSGLSSFLHYNRTLIVFSSVFFFCRSKTFQSRPSSFIPKSWFFSTSGISWAARGWLQCQRHWWTAGTRCSPWTSGNEDEMRLCGVQHIVIRFWPPFQCDPIGLNCFISQPAKSKWVVDVIWLFTGNHPWLIYLLLPGSVWAQCVAGAHKLQRKNLWWLCIVYICCHPIRGEAFMKY